MTQTEYKETRAGPKKLEIPREWEVRDLGELVSRLTNGISESQSKDDTGFPVTRIETIAQGWVNHDKVGYVDADKSEFTDYRLEEGDVLFSHINSIPHIGKTAQYQGEEELYHGMNLLLIRFDEEEIEREYGYIYLNSKLARDFWVSNCKQAVNQASLNQGEVESLPVIIPSRAEQRRIAEILSAVDEAIQQTDEIIETSKELKKGLMQDLLTKGIGHEEFKEVQLGPMTVEIASSWSVEKFGDIFNKRTESYDDEDQQINYVGLEHLETGKTEISGYKEDGAEKSSTRKFREGDILYGKLRPYLDKAAVAPFEGICSSDIIPIYSGEDSTQGYLKYLIHHKIIYNRAVSTQKGTNLPRTSWGALSSAEIPLPPLDEQREIAERLSVVDEKIRQEEEYREKLEELKKGLMQDLLTGKKRVEA